MKPTLDEQLAYCDEWMKANASVVWPSMKVERIATRNLLAAFVADWTRGDPMRTGRFTESARGDDWSYEKVIRPGHWSVLEFSWHCYGITGVSRICTHELVRHRHLSFMQESTRAIGGTGVVIIPKGISEDEEDRYLELLATRSSILVAGNGRAWAEMLRKRLCLRAAPEIRYLAWLIASDLREVAPLVYAVSIPACDKCEEVSCS